MKLAKSILDSAKVATPCHQSWAEMVGDDRVRFCGDCQINVYNLAAMTHAEAEQLIAKKEGRLCVRFYRRPDNTIITKDCPIGLKAIRQKVSHLASASFSAILAIFNLVQPISAQSHFFQDQTKVAVSTKLRTDKQPVIKGVVIDFSQAVIPSAKITILNQDKKAKVKLQTKTSENGDFSFQELPAGKYTFKIEASGFFTLKLTDIEIRQDAVTELWLPLKYTKPYQVVGAVEVN